jgi:DNA-binding SARP family transcriptional activator
VRLHALEALAERRIKTGRLQEAEAACAAAIALEPLRESAYRLLIAALLAQGNRAEAVLRFRSYRELLVDELDVEPSAEFSSLLEDLVPRDGSVTHPRTHPERVRIDA